MLNSSHYLNMSVVLTKVEAKGNDENTVTAEVNINISDGLQKAFEIDPNFKSQVRDEMIVFIQAHLGESPERDLSHQVALAGMRDAEGVVLNAAIDKTRSEYRMLGGTGENMSAKDK